MRYGRRGDRFSPVGDELSPSGGGNAFDDALSSLSCDTVVPTFTSAAYDAACDVSVNAVYYSYVSFIMMAFTGMIMISLRTAYRPVEERKRELKELLAKRAAALKEQRARQKLRQREKEGGQGESQEEGQKP
ncbi:hypothetical protein MHU86_21259 [Fragilaria crotonensis]|nr:hypothetical protein MHU86_21259 [Fragilaria crotonensis]